MRTDEIKLKVMKCHGSSKPGGGKGRVTMTSEKRPNKTVELCLLLLQLFLFMFEQLKGQDIKHKTLVVY